jgi:hypothetical protein
LLLFWLVSADAMLSVDSRAPVVFLRAFEDEERPDYRQSQEALVDFSLETRLAEHVRYIGPFVTVGCPADRAPLLGASRAKLPDSEWQGHVIEWISKASVIIMYAGRRRG